MGGGGETFLWNGKFQHPCYGSLLTRSSIELVKTKLIPGDDGVFRPEQLGAVHDHHYSMLRDGGLRSLVHVDVSALPHLGGYF